MNLLVQKLSFVNLEANEFRSFYSVNCEKLSSQAIDVRDALAKSIYSSLFDWLVEQINKSLDVEKLFTGRCINILDIYGFESFHVWIVC